MTDLHREGWSHDNWRSQIWSAPIWPTLAVLAVVGCAALGFSHHHGAVGSIAAAHASAPLTTDRSRTSVGAFTQTAFTHGRELIR